MGLLAITEQLRHLRGEFELVRDALTEASFTEDSICARCRARDFNELGPALRDVRSPAPRDRLETI